MATLAPEEEARTPNHHASNRLLYCKTFVNLSRPSNVRRHAIQFFNANGDRFSWIPCVMMDNAEVFTLMLELLLLCMLSLLMSRDLDGMF